MKYRLPVKAGVLQNLRVQVRQLWKQLRCRHTHTFEFYLNDAIWSSCGDRKWKHPGLKLTGCYLCGQVWVEDWMA